MLMMFVGNTKKFLNYYELRRCICLSVDGLKRPMIYPSAARSSLSNVPSHSSKEVCRPSKVASDRRKEWLLFHHPV